MNSIRKMVYAALLMISAFRLAPGQASAQDARGTFALAHEVHWQNAIVPAGKYRFNLGLTGAREMLVLRNLGPNGEMFMLPVGVIGEAEPGPSRIVVVSRSGIEFVSTMQLRESEIALQFAVPSETREVAQAVATTTLSAR
jgi:hypothetical protein